MKRAVGIIRNEPETAAIRTINLAVLSGDIRKLASAIHGETRSKVSEQLALWASKLEMTCEFHVSDAHTDEKGVETLRLRLRDIHDRARLFQVSTLPRAPSVTRSAHSAIATAIDAEPPATSRLVNSPSNADP